MKNFLVVVFSIMTLFVFLTGCSNGSGAASTATEYIISGTVADSVTGDAVPGAKVGIGPNILTTDSNGYYSVSVPANQAITGNFYVSKGTDYNFYLYSGINFTPISDLTFNIKIDKPGVYNVGPAEIEYNNNTYRSNDVTIEVAQDQVLKDKKGVTRTVFFELATDKQDIVLGEKINLVIKFYFLDLS